MTRKKIAGLDVEIIKKRGLKNIYIRVKPPDGEIIITAPQKVSQEFISDLFCRKLPKIIHAQERIKSQARQSKREYVSGENFYFWGRPHMLKVIYSGRRYHVELMPDRIIFTVPEKSSRDNREKALTEWYRSELKRVIPKVLAPCSLRVGVEVPSWDVRNMKTCWGTCNPRKKKILLNLQLVKKPRECLEYVIIHELVHMLERNHTKKFYALVEKFCPHWKEARRKLSEYPLDHIEK